MRANRETFQRELKRVIKQLQKMGAKRVILFGSLAKESIRVGSDIDLVVIFDDNLDFKSRMKYVYSKIECKEDLDILAYNFAEFNRLKNRSFFRNIIANGKLLYEATN